MKNWISLLALIVLTLSSASTADEKIAWYGNLRDGCKDIKEHIFYARHAFDWNNYDQRGSAFKPCVRTLPTPAALSLAAAVAGTSDGAHVWCCHYSPRGRRTASACVRAQAQVRSVKIRVAAGRVDRNRGEDVQRQGQRTLHRLLRRMRRVRRRICALRIDPRSGADGCFLWLRVTPPIWRSHARVYADGRVA